MISPRQKVIWCLDRLVEELQQVYSTSHHFYMSVNDNMSDVGSEGTDMVCRRKSSSAFSNRWDEWPLALDHLPWGLSEDRVAEDQRVLRKVGPHWLWDRDVRLRVFTVQRSVLETCHAPTALTLESGEDCIEFFGVMTVTRFLFASQ